MSDRLRRRRDILGPLGLACALALFSSDARADEVVVVLTGDNAVYGKVEASFLQDLGQGATRLGKPDPDEVRRASGGARVVFAIGPGAAKVVQELSLGSQAIYAVVPSPESVGLPSGARVIPMFVPRAQLKASAALLPNAKRIGVIYNPRFSAQMIRDCQAAATAQRMSLVEATVGSEKEVVAAVRDMIGKVDALWVIPDPTVSARPETFEFIVRTAMEAKLPVFGFSEQATRKGAVISVQVNLPDMGKRAAALARRMLSGERAGAEEPGGEIFLNARSAEQLGLQIPEALRRQATRVVD